MMTLRKLSLSLLPALATLAISACAIMSKADCIQGDWRASGFTDATRGHSSSRLLSRVRACAKHGQQPNKIAYQLGYKKGLVSYCTAERGRYEGTRNGTYRGICPGELEPPFLGQYIEGLQIARHDVRHRSFWLQDELFDARIRRVRTDNSDYRQRLSHRINRLDNRINSLRDTKFQINRKISQWTTHLVAAAQITTPDEIQIE